MMLMQVNTVVHVTDELANLASQAGEQRLVDRR